MSSAGAKVREGRIEAFIKEVEIGGWRIVTAREAVEDIAEK